MIIRNKIYEIRGQRVMLDFDLAELYEVPTKALNQAVKRNVDRFPNDFIFRLTLEEWTRNRSQTVNATPTPNPPTTQQPEDQLNKDTPMWSQFVTTSSGRRKTHLPYAFTEHGVTMLASVLRSEKAVKMSIEVVRAFIALRNFAVEHNSTSIALQEIRDRIGEHDVQLKYIYDAIENILDEKAARIDWEDRERIGFRVGEN